MHVSLTPELENLVKKQVESGRYHSSGEVVREALHLWEEQEKLRELRIAQFRKDIQAGLESGPANGLDLRTLGNEAGNGYGTKKEGVGGCCLRSFSKTFRSRMGSCKKFSRHSYRNPSAMGPRVAQRAGR